MSERVLERDFRLCVDGEQIGGTLWLPPAPRRPTPLVLAGHGLALDRRNPFPLPVLRGLAAERGIAVAAIDAPGHGERRRQDAALEYGDHWRRHGGERIARELAAAAEELQKSPEPGPGPLGYWGLSLATQYGLAFLAAPSGIRAAVLGLFRKGRLVARYARSVTCPVFFIQQLDDEVHPRESVAALYECLGSPEKQLAASRGRHVEVPAGVLDAAVEFLVRHLVD